MECAANMAVIMDTCTRLGVPIAPDKRANHAHHLFGHRGRFLEHGVAFTSGKVVEGKGDCPRMAGA